MGNFKCNTKRKFIHTKRENKKKYTNNNNTLFAVSRGWGFWGGKNLQPGLIPDAAFPQRSKLPSI